ncbi:MAG: response regulator [Methanoregula sp.]|nr:response regulator [Methanoregula sp.]
MITILYVDPDPKMCPLLSHIFEKYGQLSVYPADSGEKALAWLPRNHADVIVSEYDLPGMSGIELLNSLRSVGFSLPFIFFSESDCADAKNKAYRGDVFGFITRKGSERKPILNLLRLILWAAGSHETDYPFIGELPESEGDGNGELMKPIGRT